MRRYFLIGEDIDRTEITAKEAEYYRFDSDYKVIVEDDKSGQAVVKTAEQPVYNWEPFQFPAKAGYRLMGHTFTRYDLEGYSCKIDSLPENAVKTAEPNQWKVTYRPGCYDMIIARPVYELIQVDACGGCDGCKRMTCPRRQNGVKCRNYKA